MAAGQVGIPVGVLGGRALLAEGSNLQEDVDEEAGSATVFKFSCLCVTFLVVAALAADGSQLSLRGELTAGAAGIVGTVAEVELAVARVGGTCESGFCRVSVPEELASLKGGTGAAAPRSALGPVGGWKETDWKLPRDLSRLLSGCGPLAGLLAEP